MGPGRRDGGHNDLCPPGRKLLVQEKITLKLDLEPGTVFPVEVVQLNRILRTLVDNAREAMPQGGEFSSSLFLIRRWPC